MGRRRFLITGFSPSVAVLLVPPVVQGLSGARLSVSSEIGCSVGWFVPVGCSINCSIGWIVSGGSWETPTLEYAARSSTSSSSVTGGSFVSSLTVSLLLSQVGLARERTAQYRHRRGHAQSEKSAGSRTGQYRRRRGQARSEKLDPGCRQFRSCF